MPSNEVPDNAPGVSPTQYPPSCVNVGVVSGLTDVVAVRFNKVLQNPSEILVSVIVVFAITAETVTVAVPPVKVIVFGP